MVDDNVKNITDMKFSVSQLATVMTSFLVVVVIQTQDSVSVSPLTMVVLNVIVAVKATMAFLIADVS